MSTPSLTIVDGGRTSKSEASPPGDNVVILPNNARFSARQVLDMLQELDRTSPHVLDAPLLIKLIRPTAVFIVSGPIAQLPDGLFIDCVEVIPD